MGWLKRKSDPIAQQEKTLAAQIAELESQIKQLDSRLQREQSQPKAAPAPPPPSAAPKPHAPAPVSPPPDLVIESGRRPLLDGRPEPRSTPQHYNELGVRKYDLVALWERIRGWFAGPGPANPKLLIMLAAGNIEGLRPLRIEKRKARRRFLVLAALLFLVLLGIISVFIRHG